MTSSLLRFSFLSISALLVLSPSGRASAQSLAEEQGTVESEEERAPGSERLGDEQADAEEEGGGEHARDPNDPREEPNVDYFFLGAFYRHVMIPSFIQQLFVDGGIEADNPGAGLSFTYRKNDFSVVANLWWNGAQGQGFFRALGDPRTDTEHIIADMGLVFLNAEFLWAFPITDWFAFELGFDLGFGFIYGDIERTEAYESNSGRGDWRPCSGPGDPEGGAYCEAPAAPPPCYRNSGGHYQCSEPNWLTEGGDVPVIFPWVAFPHIALRFKPIRQVQIRIDGGYALYGFFAGGAVSYGF